MANVTKSVAMNSGKGPSSYTPNSSFQRGGLHFSKAVLEEAIADHLDIKHFSPPEHFTIADLGCATGPNTVILVQNVLDAIKLKYPNCPEFQAYFNDLISNDFNTLFRSIPLDHHYFAAGVPGSFYGRLFPNASFHFVHSAYSLHWLSRIPKQLSDKESPAWNPGRITYRNAPTEVCEAFSAQFEEDMTSFLNARAEEMVSGGLMALHLMATPDEVPSHESTFIETFDLMGSCLMDMAKQGLLDEARIDSFNMPVYNTSLKQMERLIQGNGWFSIVKKEMLPGRVAPDAETTSKNFRAITETIFKEHFGGEIMDELYCRITEKVADTPVLFQHNVFPPNELFIILKRQLTQ